jgi:hypothetical protein
MDTLNVENNSNSSQPLKVKNNYKLVTIIACLLIIFSVGFFILGIKFTEAKPQKVQYVTQEKIVKVYPTEDPKDLVNRCGDIPMSIYKNTGHFDMIDGPEWAPDCRHIAWSLWESGVGYEGSDPAIIKELESNPPRKLSGREGIFLLTDSTQNVQKIYNPKELDESPVFIRWENKDTIIFKAKNVEYSYSLSTKEQTQVEK